VDLASGATTVDARAGLRGADHGDRFAQAARATGHHHGLARQQRRDRTELATLEHRLDASRHVTDTLRAQAHEFANRLHTISGLLELEECLVSEADILDGLVASIRSNS